MALRFVDWPQELIDEYNYNMFGHTLVCNEKKEDTKMKKYTVKAAFADEIFGKEVSTDYIEECMRNGMPEEDVMALVAEYGNEVLDKFETEDDDLKKYRIRFTDGKEIVMEAVNEFALGSYTIIEWAAEEFGVDSDDIFTDGEDIWVEKDGEQTKLATVSSIEEIE